jgi:hypothetical protein
VRHNEHMSEGARKGSRRAAPTRRTPDRRTVLLVVGALAALVAWGALVYAGIRFGQSARGGEGAAWIFMAVAGLGAVACLFLALMLGTKLLNDATASKGESRPAGKRVAHRN